MLENLKLFPRGTLPKHIAFPCLPNQILSIPTVVLWDEYRLFVHSTMFEAMFPIVHNTAPDSSKGHAANLSS